MYRRPTSWVSCFRQRLQRQAAHVAKYLTVDNAYLAGTDGAETQEYCTPVPGTVFDYFE